MNSEKVVGISLFLVLAGMLSRGEGVSGPGVCTVCDNLNESLRFFSAFSCNSNYSQLTKQ